MTPLAGRVWEARNPDYERVVRDAFEANKAMSLLGAALGEVSPGVVEIELPVHEMLMSHLPGIVHGGTIGMIADSALGFAALSLALPGAVGVTAEYKINMLAPATGERMLARAEVIKPGKRLTVARAEVSAFDGGEQRLVAVALATMIPL
jgi:uncharacterized protein (TIGR00369 family)